MALPASGQISFNDLRVELGISGQAPFSITSASTNLYVTINTNSPSFPNSSAPHAISEWYSYDHTYSAATCAALNSGASLDYADNTPADPSNCTGVGDEYDLSQVFYAFDNNCTVLGDGCTVYDNSSCTSTAYSIGARYITDGSNYYTLNASSVSSLGGGCSA
jgi:hypothetical protein